MPRTLMIQGTGSGVGKSLMVAALCRIFNDMAINVAPFKSQNMALNSYVTTQGGEIGRAQALQAEAARIEPTIDMNPILLKAAGDMGSQVIIHGRVHANMQAKQYYAFKKEAWKAVTASFEALAKNFELIFIEGAGSPAEINLMREEIVNMAMAKYAKAPVILVSDIDRGGVFASLYGTVKLIGRDSRYIKAFIINKFRGDISILEPGLKIIQQKTGRPVIGVLPYMHNIGLPEEDGLNLRHRLMLNRTNFSQQELIRIVVLSLSYMANFTDFDPFLCEPDVDLIYSTNPTDIENADLVIVPGSKNTVKDLLYLKEKHLDDSLKRAYLKGAQIIGICGGYQMLGQRVYDPYKMESPHRVVSGLGFLNTETYLEKCKTTCQVEILTGDCLPYIGSDNKDKKPLTGYEIHLGSTKGDIGLFKLKRSYDDPALVMDGSINGNCWGTYVHGIFENDGFRRGLINHLRGQKGLPPVALSMNYAGLKDRAIDNLADMVRENIDLDHVKQMLKL